MRKKRVSLSKSKIVLVLYALYILNQVLSASQLININIYSSILSFMRYILFAAITTYVFFFGMKYTSKNKFYLLVMLISAGIMNMVLKDGGMSILITTMFIIAYKNKQLDRLFVVTFWTILISNLIVILCCMFGVIEDTISVRWLGTQTGKFFSGRYDRHTFGFLVQNQIPNAFFLLYLILVYLYKDALKVKWDVFILIINYIIFTFFGARISFVLTIIVAFAHISLQAMKRFKKQTRQVHHHRIAPWSFVVCCILSFCTCAFYRGDSKLSRALDMILNNRVRLGSEALNFYGVKLLGSGKTSGTYMGALSNNTVDNGYLLLFIQFGMVIGLAIIVLWIYVAFLSSKNIYCTLVICAFAMLNIVDSHLTSYMAIPFMCVFYNQNDSILYSVYKKQKWRRHIILQEGRLL